jgi:tellurite resistance protein
MSTPPTKEQVESLKERVAKLSYTERVNKAAQIINESDGKFEQSQVMTYLIEMVGLTMTEYLEALNIASDGELLRNV